MWAAEGHHSAGARGGYLAGDLCLRVRFRLRTSGAVRRAEPSDRTPRKICTACRSTRTVERPGRRYSSAPACAMLFRVL